jgi:hypothetical protein
VNEQTHRRHRALTVLLALAAGAAFLAPPAAQASPRYDFTYGGGPAARFWLAAGHNPGTCDIATDYNQTQAAPVLNTIDSVVLSTAAAGIRGKTITITWGAQQQPPVGMGLMVRAVSYPDPTGCPTVDKTITASSGTFAVGAHDYLVVTAAPGTVKPWFSFTA